MKLPPCLLLLLAGAVPAIGATDLPPLRMRAQTIDPGIQIGYGLAIADVDGDRKPDILLADAKQIVWYRNPSWQKFVIAEQLTARDHVCIAARDLDGDGKAEVAVGAEWNPGDTMNSGAVFLLEPPADRTQRWTARRLPHEPTTHRMQWVTLRGGPALAVLPLHGRGNRNNAGDGVRFLAYPWPYRDATEPVVLAGQEAGLHATHNFDVAAEELLVAAKEGVRAISLRDPAAPPRVLTTAGAGEVRGGRGFIATIEPMHGNELVVYRPAAGGRGGSDWTASRTVLDETLVQGHALALGDLLGAGRPQIVVGWRGGGKPGARVGIKLFAPADARAERWSMHGWIDDNTMACEDLQLADLNGDGRLDVVAAGRATRNVIIYWNETGR